MKKTIKIKNRKYAIKYTIRALFIFEQITGKAFELKTMLDNYLFLYSIILANNSEHILEWDDFLSALDEDPTIYTQLMALVDNHSKKEDIFEVEDKETGEKKS